MYLLDTNVISETIKKSPNQKVIQWLSSVDASQFLLSILTIGEIRKGIEKLQDTAKKQSIIQWLENDLATKFHGRIIPIDQNIAEKWGYLSAYTNIPAIDGLIAATALVFNYKLVTRNTKDFENIIGLEIMNPWDLREEIYNDAKK
ncbi:MAG: type II toxin-antitoxin system VapC family toxin [Gammaproteobacteria bacterium]|nr:type II toxin-antitoxin system VapC family toxin [Gammaproteobacteria bacterium]